MVCCPAGVEAHLQHDELTPMKVNEQATHVTSTVLLQMYEEERAKLPHIQHQLEAQLEAHLREFY